LATTSKDKKLRLVDPRTEKAVGKVEAHAGVKGGRAIWLGSKEKIFSCGFTKTSEREYCLWDPRDLTNPLSRQSVDSASGILMPFYDNDTSVLFLGGKGDGNIRYYEVVDEAPYIHFLSEYKSATPQRGLAMLPKRAVNVSECEIVRILKVGTKTVEPIAFNVPRKSDLFQDDIFPDCYAGEPALSAAEWLGGANANPKTVSLQGGFVKKDKPQSINFEKAVEEKPLSEKELKEEVDKLAKRVSYLESELIKRDARIKELENK